MENVSQLFVNNFVSYILVVDYFQQNLTLTVRVCLSVLFFPYFKIGVQKLNND